MESRIKLLKALANPSRLKIVESLRDNDLYVNQIKDLLKIDISTASKHLSHLKSVNLVSSYRSGNTIYYRLTCPCILDFFDCLDKMIVEKE